MKRILFILISILCLSSVASAQYNDYSSKKKVAVYVTGTIQESYKKVLGTKLVSSITRSNRYVAVERSNDFLRSLSREQDYQSSGAVTDNQIAALGQQYGVDFVLAADFHEMFGQIVASCRMIDVETALIVLSSDASENISDLNDLYNLADNLVSGFADSYNPRERSDDSNKMRKIGPFTTDEELYNFSIPGGYRQITLAEFEKLLETQEIEENVYLDIKTQSNKSSYNTFYSYKGRMYSWSEYLEQVKDKKDFLKKREKHRKEGRFSPGIIRVEGSYSKYHQNYLGYKKGDYGYRPDIIATGYIYVVKKDY